MHIPTDQQILHILNQEFIIDGQEDVREPLGMSGVRLEVKVHIVTGAVSAAQNIMKCVRRCGLEVSDLILQPLASAMAVLSEDEKDLGVCLVDIGGGTTDIAVFTARRDPPHRGDPDRRRSDHQRHRDGAAHADQGRRGHQAALRLRAARSSPIRSRWSKCPASASAARAQLSRQTLAEVIEPRVEELYSLVQAELRRSGYEELLSSGIVITGGSQLDAGHGRARRGDLPHAGARGRAALHRRPGRSGAQSALLHRGRAAASPGCSSTQREQIVRMQIGSFKQVFERMKSWFTGNF